MTQITSSTVILADLAEHAAGAPAPLSGDATSDPQSRALVRAHGNDGVLYCKGTFNSRSVRSLVKKGYAEAIVERGRTDRRQVVIGMRLTVRGTREALRIIKGA